MKPEEKVEIILFDWLITKSKNVKNVYFNRKNVLNISTFQTKGINKKPDFIVELAKGKEFLALEIKDEKHSKSILDAGKILDVYYKNYVEGKTKYFINKKEIKINHFGVASGSSMKGYLFDSEKIICVNDNKNKSKRFVASIGLIPKIEGDRSHVFVRELWARINRLENYERKPSLGILISKGIYPYLFCKKYFINKKRWSQAFIEL